MALIPEFQPWPALIEGRAAARCKAVVIIPARNEEESLAATLDSLAAQVDLEGKPLPASSFEILLLLNNCTDASATVAAGWAASHPQIAFHWVERTLVADEAFVGTARRLLMDTAWQRLADAPGTTAILSTDSDTIAAPDWIAANLRAIAAGADAVGGMIELKAGELQSLPASVRRAYLRDRRYQSLVAELEDRLDPQQGDPAPRHLQHFGASLACTPQAYARAGGMPAITPLEDVAFIGRLRHTGAKLRHDPAVKVYTSSRMYGRVEVGLSGQLLIWHHMYERGEEHTVQSAAWLAHRFRTLGKLRADAASQAIPAADYLAQVDCDRIVEETFRGDRTGDITSVNRRLAAMLRGTARADRAGNPHAVPAG